MRERSEFFPIKLRGRGSFGESEREHEKCSLDFGECGDRLNTSLRRLSAGTLPRVSSDSYAESGEWE